MIHSLSRHGADPKKDAAPAELEMGEQTKIDCSLEEIETFLKKLWRDPSISRVGAIEIVLPTLDKKGRKAFVMGVLTYIFGYRIDHTKLKLESGENVFDTILAKTSGKESSVKRTEKPKPSPSVSF